MNELATIGSFATGEYDLKDFMLSSALNLAATKIPAVAIAMVFVWSVQYDPRPSNFINPICPKDNTNNVIRYLSY